MLSRVVCVRFVDASLGPWNAIQPRNAKQGVWRGPEIGEPAVRELITTCFAPGEIHHARPFGRAVS
jgi:hypothetical protein